MAFIVTCPICGPRRAYEFRFGGEDKGPRPEQAALTAEQWCDYVHNNNCLAGIQQEWWYHRSGCGAWFTICRDTRTCLETPATTSGRPEALDEQA